MEHEDAVAIVGMLDEVIRSRRGAALYPGGVPTNIAVVWVQEIEKLADAEIATRAVADIYIDSMERPPTIRDVKDAYRNIELTRRATTPALPEAEFIREIPDWLKGWIVARAAGDMRTWPQQKEGYDALQLFNPHYRTYVWPDQDEMPEEERAGYEKRGVSMTATQLWALLESAVVADRKMM